MRILVVEDDLVLGEAITHRIRRMGHGVDLVIDGLKAKDTLKSQRYDLILLDLNLPNLNGQKVLESIRKQQQKTPVIILTARNQVEDKIQLLNLGADDYLAKPFDFGELEARCQALLRRSIGQAKNLIEFGNITLNQQACSLLIADNCIKLKQREFRLLEIFLGHPGQVLSKETLIDHIYGFDESPSPNVIEIYVARLRKSLAPSNVNIRTLRGLGYVIDISNE